MRKLEWFSPCQSGQQPLMNIRGNTTVKRIREGKQKETHLNRVTNPQVNVRLLSHPSTHPDSTSGFKKQFPKLLEPGRITMDILFPWKGTDHCLSHCLASQTVALQVASSIQTIRVQQWRGRQSPPAQTGQGARPSQGASCQLSQFQKPCTTMQLPETAKNSKNQEVGTKKKPSARCLGQRNRNWG